MCVCAASTRATTNAAVIAAFYLQQINRNGTNRETRQSRPCECEREQKRARAHTREKESCRKKHTTLTTMNRAEHSNTHELTRILSQAAVGSTAYSTHIHNLARSFTHIRRKRYIHIDSSVAAAAICM